MNCIFNVFTIELLDPNQKLSESLTRKPPHIIQQFAWWWVKPLDNSITADLLYIKSLSCQVFQIM